MIVDCTTASPLNKEIKDYKPGEAANRAVDRKIKDYRKYFHIDDSASSRLWFFAVETNGCLSKEAKDYCRMLTKTSKTPGALKNIYQRLSVGFQNAIARQIHKAANYYTCVDRPLPPIAVAPIPAPGLTWTTGSCV